MTNRSRDYYRKMRKRAIHKKERIINSYRLDNPPAYEIDSREIISGSGYGRSEPYWHVKHSGMLSKGKIHCSCSMCAFHGTTIQDKRKLMSMTAKIDDYLEDIIDCDDTAELFTLKVKIKKKINGEYYPNSSGSRSNYVLSHSESKVFDYEDFRMLIAESNHLKYQRKVELRQFFL